MGKMSYGYFRLVCREGGFSVRPEAKSGPPMRPANAGASADPDDDAAALYNDDSGDDDGGEAMTRPTTRTTRRPRRERDGDDGLPFECLMRLIEITTGLTGLCETKPAEPKGRRQ
jgi:hypothetical protein